MVAVLTPEEARKEAERLYLNDAMFGARVRLALNLAYPAYTPTEGEVRLLIYATFAALWDSETGMVTNTSQALAEVYAQGLDFAADECHRKARFAYGRSPESVTDLVDVEEALRFLAKTARAREGFLAKVDEAHPGLREALANQTQEVPE